MRVSTMRQRTTLICTTTIPTLRRLYACKELYSLFWKGGLCLNCVRRCSSAAATASLQPDVDRLRVRFSGKPPKLARRDYHNRRRLNTVSNGVMNPGRIGC